MGRVMNGAMPAGGTITIAPGCVSASSGVGLGRLKSMPSTTSAERISRHALDGHWIISMTVTHRNWGV